MSLWITARRPTAVQTVVVKPIVKVMGMGKIHPPPELQTPKTNFHETWKIYVEDKKTCANAGGVATALVSTCGTSLQVQFIGGQLGKTGSGTEPDQSRRTRDLSYVLVSYLVYLVLLCSSAHAEPAPVDRF